MARYPAINLSLPLTSPFFTKKYGFGPITPKLRCLPLMDLVHLGQKPAVITSGSGSPMTGQRNLLVRQNEWHFVISAFYLYLRFSMYVQYCLGLLLLASRSIVRKGTLVMLAKSNWLVDMMSIESFPLLSLRLLPSFSCSSSESLFGADVTKNRHTDWDSKFFIMFVSFICLRFKIMKDFSDGPISL